jgi:hypothetical protein
LALDGPLGCRYLSVDPKERPENAKEKPEDFIKNLDSTIGQRASAECT